MELFDYLENPFELHNRAMNPNTPEFLMILEKLDRKMAEIGDIPEHDSAGGPAGLRRCSRRLIVQYLLHAVARCGSRRRGAGVSRWRSGSDSLADGSARTVRSDGDLCGTNRPVIPQDGEGPPAGQPAVLRVGDRHRHQCTLRGIRRRDGLCDGSGAFRLVACVCRPVG